MILYHALTDTLEGVADPQLLHVLRNMWRSNRISEEVTELDGATLEVIEGCTVVTVTRATGKKKPRVEDVRLA